MAEVNESDKTVKVLFLLLLPFFMCLIIYYIIEQLPKNQISNDNLGGFVLLKVMITLLLCVYVMSCCYAFQIEWKFCVLISLGLIFSSGGDGLSLYDGKIDNVFLYDLILYGCAHIFYIIAFGFKPVSPVIGIFIALPFIGLLMVLIPRMTSPKEYYISVYTIITIVMEWRIITKISQHSGPLNPSVIMMTIGTTCLAISDAVLTYDRFHSTIRFSNVIIPAAYYLGQLGIASSIFHLPHELRPPNPYLHVSGDEICEQLCSGCPF